MKIMLLILSLISANAFAEILDIKSSEKCIPETDDCISSLTIVSSTSEIVVENVMGEFYLSKVNNQVLDCGGSVLRRTDSANIIDEKGNKIKIKHKEDLADCGITHDQKLYWFIYETVSQGNWLAEVLVFNKNGEQVYTATAQFNSKLNFQHNGDNYVITISDIP